MSLCHAWCAQAPGPAAQVWRHESVKTWQVLVSLTACMVSSILARPDELNMKSPVAVNGCRAWFFLGERYRLPVLLRLHAISMVGQLVGARSMAARARAVSLECAQLLPRHEHCGHDDIQCKGCAVSCSVPTVVFLCPQLSLDIGYRL